MIVRLAWKTITRNKKMVRLILLQMVLMFVVVIGMTSTITSRFTYYNAVKDALTMQGDYFYFTNGQHAINHSAYTAKSELLPYLSGNAELSGSYFVWMNAKAADQDWDVNRHDVRAYDDFWLEAYTPTLASGTWFDLQANDDGRVPIVVSQNDRNYTVGTELTLTDFSSGTDYQFPAVVIGVLKEGAMIPDPLPGKDAFSARNFFSPYYAEGESKIRILVPARYLTSAPCLQANGNFLLTYPEPVSDEIRQQNRVFLQECNSELCYTTEELRANSIAYSFAQCKILLPVLIAILVMLLISGISINALSAKQELRNNAIFVLCGFRWRACALIHLVSSLMQVTLALVISVLGILLLQSTSLLESTVVRIGPWQLLTSVGMVLFYVLISAWLPFQINRHYNPRQVLQANEGGLS